MNKLHFMFHHFFKFNSYLFSLPMMAFAILMCISVINGEECESSASREHCRSIGSLNGMIHALDSVVTSVGDIISAVKHNAEKVEGNICLKQKTTTHLANLDEDYCLKAEPDCFALQEDGFKSSGVYRIWPRFLNHSIKVYCDMHTDGGGWTLIQRRGKFREEPINFFETWDKYKMGFGNLSEEFWLGNDFIFALTQQRKTTLRIDLEDFDGEKKFAKYGNFIIRSELENYKLEIGNYSGDAGDSMEHHRDSEFGTKDRGNKCAKDYKGGWWYKSCHKANLNGIYHHGNHTSFADGINWHEFRGYHHSMKSSEMKIRPSTC